MTIKDKHTDFTTGFTIRDKVIYYTLFSIVYLISLLPFPVLYALSDMLYLLIYKLVGYRKKLVRKNLRESFPEKSAEELKSIEKKFYHFFCDYIMETIKLTSISKEEMRRRVKYTGMEHVNEYLEKGHNVVLYIGHYCNWEWITSIGLHVSDDVLVGQIYHILENKPFNALLLYIRSRMGTESISMQVTLRKIIEKRREGTPLVIGFISDQVPLYQATRHWLTFLNHDGTIVITGTEQIAKQMDFSCVYLDVSCPRRGYYNIDVVPMCEESKGIPNWELTDQYFQLFEQSIRRAPEYWLWTHNRWKRDQKGFEQWQKEH